MTRKETFHIWQRIALAMVHSSVVEISFSHNLHEDQDTLHEKLTILTHCVKNFVSMVLD